MKEILIKDWKENRLLGIYSSEEIPNLINHEVSECNIKCKTFIRKLWNDISTKVRLLKELYIIVKTLKKINTEPVYCIFGVCKKILRKPIYEFFTIIAD